MGGGARGNLDLLGLLFPRVIPFELKITKIAIITIFLEKVRSNAILCVSEMCYIRIVANLSSIIQEIDIYIYT